MRECSGRARVPQVRRTADGLRSSPLGCELAPVGPRHLRARPRKAVSVTLCRRCVAEISGLRRSAGTGELVQTLSSGSKKICYVARRWRAARAGDPRRDRTLAVAFLRCLEAAGRTGPRAARPRPGSPRASPRTACTPSARRDLVDELRGSCVERAEQEPLRVPHGGRRGRARHLPITRRSSASKLSAGTTQLTRPIASPSAGVSGRSAGPAPWPAPARRHGPAGGRPRPE